MDKYLLLEKSIGYSFNDYSFLQNALTHSSYGADNYERLEFLGDSLLNFIIAEELFKIHHNVREGELSRMRSSIVKGETLAIVAKQLGLGEFLQLGLGELKTGGKKRKSNLADALEAVIAAIYLDADFNTCKAVVLQWFKSKISTTTPKLAKDSKTKLQEYLQSKKINLPVYEVVDMQAAPEENSFKVSCSVPDLNLTSFAEGSSRRVAEQRAAKKILVELEQ